MVLKWVAAMLIVFVKSDPWLSDFSLRKVKKFSVNISSPKPLTWCSSATFTAKHKILLTTWFNMLKKTSSTSTMRTFLSNYFPKPSLPKIMRASSSSTWTSWFKSLSNNKKTKKRETPPRIPKVNLKSSENKKWMNCFTRSPHHLSTSSTRKRTILSQSKNKSSNALTKWSQIISIPTNLLSWTWMKSKSLN